MTAATDSPLLRIEHLTKDYRKGVRANDDISLDVRSGEVLGLLGHNGAGKTTLLSQVIGLARPTSGSIRIDGRDAIADPAMARRVCSIQPQAQAPLDGITPRQAVELMARIRGAGRRRARAHTSELLAVLDLDAWADTVCDKLSGGVRRLTAFCMAAVEPSRLVMFDEPTNDVDPVRRQLLWSRIRALADDGCAVVLVTHNVVEAERVVDRLIVLDRGTVVTQGTPAQLRQRHNDDVGDNEALRIELTAVDATAAEQLLWELGNGAGSVTGQRAVLLVPAASVTSAIAWAQEQRTNGLLEEFAVTPVSLEDVYIGLVGHDSSDEGEAHADLAP